MLPDYVRNYLLHGLNDTPVTLDFLLKHASERDYDRRPDPQRFTVREVLGHLADWESIWLERMLRMRDEDNPTLPGYDEGQLAIDHDYAHQDVTAQQTRFREGRAELMAYLHTLEAEGWQRAGVRTEGEAIVGRVTVEALATLILAHDAYHLRQIAEWLERAGD